MTRPWRSQVVEWALPLMVVIALVAAPQAVAGTGEAAVVPPSGRAPITVRVATGVGHIRETWNPHNCSGLAVNSGWSPTVEVAVGAPIASRLLIGGLWQSAGLFNPRQAYLGTDYHLTELVKVVDTVSVFTDYLFVPRLRLHGGAALGIGALSTWDMQTGGVATSWGAASSGFLGYDHKLSDTWAVGVIGRLTVYRSSLNTTPSSASSTGLFPSLLLSFVYGRTAVKVF